MTPRTASTAAISSSRSKKVSSMKRSTPRPSRIRACSAYSGPCSPASNTSSSPSGPIAPAMRTSRPGHLARLAREAHRGRVDRLELVLEELAGELAAVGPEGVRLDQLGAGADVARVHGDDALGGAQIRLLGAAQARRTAPRSSAPMPPSATIGGPAAQPFEEIRHTIESREGRESTRRRSTQPG